MKKVASANTHEIYLKLSKELARNRALPILSKVKQYKDEVQVLHSRKSYKMETFAEDNCLIELDEEKTEYKMGESVKVYPFNQW